MIFGVNIKVIEKYESIYYNKDCIIIGNHESLLETIFIFYFLKNPVPIVKKEVIQIPVIGSFLMKYGCISIDRDNIISSIKNIRKNASKFEGRPIVLFPEGTRSESLKEAKTGGVRVLKICFPNYKIVPMYVKTGHIIKKSLRINRGTASFEIGPKYDSIESAWNWILDKDNASNS
jgi:1-acyl-sn-glycerol-3-phosphate acyltransferase